MPDEAIVDAGLDTGVDEPIEVATESVSVDTATTDAPIEAEVDTAAPAPTSAPYRAVSEDGKRLDEKARATIDEIKAKDPALAREIRNALFEADRFKRALPGGLKEVTELRQTVEQLGGPEGIQGMQAEVQGWGMFDQQYMAGDPKALEFMLSTPDAQQAFVKLAPMAMNKFEELHPEAYASYLCQRIVGDAVANDVPVALKLAQHFLSIGDATQANEQFGKVVAWFQGLDATAKKPVAPKEAPKPTGEDPRLKELQQRDTERTRDEWRQETAREQNSVYTAELNRLLAGRKASDTQREDILLRVQTKLALRIKEHEKTLDQYFKVRDKEGFLKFANSFSKKHIPELLREAVDRYMPAKPGPKAQVQPNGAVRPPLAKPADGFQRVDGAPRDIDWENPFNSNQNVKQGKAILKDGRKVSWR